MCACVCVFLVLPSVVTSYSVAFNSQLKLEINMRTSLLPVKTRSSTLKSLNQFSALQSVPISSKVGISEFLVGYVIINAPPGVGIIAGKSNSIWQPLIINTYWMLCITTFICQWLVFLSLSQVRKTVSYSIIQHLRHISCFPAFMCKL